MIDHTGFVVSNFKRSRDFFVRALALLGYQLVMKLSASQTGYAEVAGFGVPPKPDFWISSGEANTPRIHIAFRAPTRAEVDAFYLAALTADGRDNGQPGYRSHYHPHYYGAFVFDLDGHNIEAVCHDA